MIEQAGPRRASRGQTLALFALMLPFVLMGLLAVGIDGANLFMGYRDAQSAADLAALAGARLLPDNPSAADQAAARTMALTIAANNGFSSGVTVTTPYVDATGSHDSQIAVAITNDVRLFIGPALVPPVDTLPISVRAVAASEWAASGGTFPAVFAGCRSSSECSDPDKAIDWSGSDGNSIIGGVHSNCGISVSGSNNDVVGATGYSSNNGCGFSNGGSGNSYETTPASAPNQTFPVTYTFSDFTCDFTQNGKLELKNYYQSGTTLRPGTYCATGSNAEIDLGDGNVTGNVTLVVYRGAAGCGSGGKAISIGGSGFDLDAYDPNRVLMWTNVGDSEIAVKISGSNGTWSGLIVAPCGQVEISGQSVGTSGGGSILANRVKIAGSNVIIDSNGLSAFGPPTLLSLRLVE